MGNIMDQERPWERNDWNKPTKRKTETKKQCSHDWKTRFAFVYNYIEWYCTKCKKVGL